MFAAIIIIILVIVQLVLSLLKHIVFTDMLLIIAICGIGLTNYCGWHMVFALLVGVALAIVLYFLVKIPILGKVLLVACGGAWAYFAYQIVDSNVKTDIGEPYLTSMLKTDPIMWWGIVIVGTLVFVALHVTSAIREHCSDNISTTPQQPTVIYVAQPAMSTALSEYQQQVKVMPIVDTSAIQDDEPGVIENM